MDKRIEMLPVSALFESPDNPRKTFSETSLQEMASTMREVGVQQPLKVRPMPRMGDTAHFEYEIIFGHRRFRAAKLAELEGKAAKWQAEAQRITKLTDSIRFEDALKQAQTGKTLQEMEQLAAQQQAMQTEQAALQAQLLDTIQQQIDAIAL